MANLRCGGGVTIGDMDYFVRPPTSAVELGSVACEAGAGGCPYVADYGGFGAVQDAASDKARCEGAAEAAAVVLCLFAFLAGDVSRMCAPPPLPGSAVAINVGAGQLEGHVPMVIVGRRWRIVDGTECLLRECWN